MKKIFFFLSFILILTSCGGDDDICLSGDSTPRLKLKFHDADGKLKQLDSLYVNVDYGNAKLTNVMSAAKVDSVFIPLKIDDSPYTDVYFKTTINGDSSKVRISYDSKAIYVSPACGFKKNYQNLKAELLKSNPVLNVEQNHTSLTDENTINFYLRF
jgi:methionine synthase II (cobalamin-independent)